MDPRAAVALKPWFPDLDLDRVRLVHTGPFAWFVRSILRQGAMTMPPYIFFGRHAFDPTSSRSLALLAHELEHVRQYREMGYLRFLITYGWHRLKAGKYSRNLPLESGPYALQDEVRTALEAPRTPDAMV